MAKCTALGWASSVGEGSCPASISVDLAVQLMEEAIDRAQTEATKGCRNGCICKGNGLPTGPPVCNSWTFEGKQYHRWVVYATFDGVCDCSKASAEDESKKLVARDYRDFFRKVSDLPRLPRRPKGPCRLYSQQHGRGFYYPVCAGECKTGKCSTTITAKPGSVVAECDCR
jgi:hypothetical protein